MPGASPSLNHRSKQHHNSDTLNTGEECRLVLRYVPVGRRERLPVPFAGSPSFCPPDRDSKAEQALLGFRVVTLRQRKRGVALRIIILGQNWRRAMPPPSLPRVNGLESPPPPGPNWTSWRASCAKPNLFSRFLELNLGMEEHSPPCPLLGFNPAQSVFIAAKPLTSPGSKLKPGW